MNKKRKKSVPLSDDSINCRRSSLQVNLSCASDLTDSGNESLKHPDVECHDNVVLNKVKCIGCLRSNASTCSNEKRTGISYVPLKNASVILERINQDDEALNRSCSRLKTAILMKTKQIFDEQSELSVKTCTVLTDKDDRLNSGSAKTVLCANKENVSAVSGNTNNGISLNERINVTRNINGTSMDKYVNKERKQDRYRKRRLFVAKQETNNKTINDNSLISKLRTLKSNDECRSNNNVITRTDENPTSTVNVSLNTLSKLISSSRTRSCESDNFIASGDRSVSILNISKDDDTFMATPIACSTMINENDEISSTEHDVQSRVKNNLLSVSNMRAKGNITSMEVTDACEGFILYDKPRSLIERVKKGTSANCQRKEASCNCISMVEKRVFSHTDSSDEKLLRRVSTKFIDTTVIDRDIERNSDIDTGSANTEKTSLNVNTSIDLISQSDKNMDKHGRKRKEKECSKFKSSHNEDALSTLSKKTQESTSTVRTSLRMNTSLNILETGPTDTEDQSRDASENNTGTSNNIYKTKDGNSFKRSVNCFNDKNMKPKQREKATDRYDRIVDNVRGNEQSYVEATPYPMYRSVMLRSQLRQTAESCPLHSNDQFNNDKSKLHNFTDMYFKDQEKMKVSNNLSHKRYNTKTGSRVIVPRTNENKLEKDANFERVDKKRCKKRLMPLNEHSQVSLSPVEKPYSPPRCLTFRKKLVKRKNNGSKIDTNGIRRDEKDEEISYNEKNKNREKRVKKIVGKKIVVKKIVNQEILKRLQENGENFNKSRIDMQGSYINSSNDFQSVKGSSTTRCKRKKAFRISIVTTGLSNDDKGIVKRVVKALGFARIESNVTKRTTHIVTTGVRTINLLHGIIRGCWIVGLEWVLKSLENDAWLNPQEYEMTHFSKAVLENRKDRQLFGSSYVPELFAACGYIHIESNTTPPCNVLKDLVKTAGGCITENPEIAKVVIGTEGLKETWVFDCITSGELQPYNHYVRS